MLTPLLHRIVAVPCIYDAVQAMVGEKQIRRRLAERTAPLREAGVLLDLGGGTGLYGDLWPPSTRYLCIDIDPQKLCGFRRKHPHGTAVLGDAARVPLADHSVDVVLCTFVAHHLPDELLPLAFAEVARILKPSGRLVFMDPLWAPRRRIGRLLWRYDRGSHPRTPEALRARIGEHLDILHWEQFAIYHEYVLCLAAPRPTASEVTGPSAEAVLPVV